MSSAVPRLWTRVRETSFSAGTYDAALPTAMFDFDSTLCPYFRRGPPKEMTLKFLSRLATSFNLVIVSNRNGNNPLALEPVQLYVDNLDALTESRITVYAPHRRDRDRKPHTGTWEHFIEFMCGGARPRFAFYCGDAAGRPGDHSAADYMYALNIGVPFLTAESVFGNGGRGGIPWTDPEVLGASAELPREFKKDAGANQSTDAIFSTLLKEPCLVVMVGSPASGKSRIATQLSKDRNFVYAGSDVHGSRLMGVFQTALKRRKSIVVDNTSPRVGDRKQFAEEAKRHDYTIIFCHVTTPKTICIHLNAARCQLDATGGTKELPIVALHVYWKNFEPPTKNEVEQYGGTLLHVNFSLVADAPREVSEFRYPLYEKFLRAATEFKALQLQ